MFTSTGAFLMFIGSSNGAVPGNDPGPAATVGRLAVTGLIAHMYSHSHVTEEHGGSVVE